MMAYRPECDCLTYAGKDKAGLQFTGQRSQREHHGMLNSMLGALRFRIRRR
jgi:hypothetical protein